MKGHILFVNGPLNGQAKSIDLENHSKDGVNPRWLFPDRIRCGTKEDETYILVEIMDRGHSSYYYICGGEDRKESDQRIDDLNRRLDWHLVQSMDKDEKISRLEKDLNLFLEFYVDQSDDCHERVLKDFKEWKEGQELRQELRQETASTLGLPVKNLYPKNITY